MLHSNGKHMIEGTIGKLQFQKEESPYDCYMRWMRNIEAEIAELEKHMHLPKNTLGDRK